MKAKKLMQQWTCNLRRTPSVPFLSLKITLRSPCTVIPSNEVGKSLELYDITMDYTQVPSSMVRLNIGGKKFCTTVDTLTLSEPDSMLAAMFSGRHLVCTDSEKGYVFVNRDGKHFRHILNWLRDGVVPMLKDFEYLELLREAEYFQLLGLIDGIKSALSKKKEDEELGTELTRIDIIKCIQSKRLSFCGVNLSGLDLSKLDLSCVNFTGANLRAAQLAGANLGSANLQTADRTNANLEGARLVGANLEGAKLTNANLKGADL